MARWVIIFAALAVVGWEVATKPNESLPYVESDRIVACAFDGLSYCNDFETHDFPSVANNSCDDHTISGVTGVTANQRCEVVVSFPPEANLLYRCHTTASETVIIRACNISNGSINPDSHDFGYIIFDP